MLWQQPLRDWQHTLPPMVLALPESILIHPALLKHKLNLLAAKAFKAYFLGGSVGFKVVFPARV